MRFKHLIASAALSLGLLDPGMSNSDAKEDIKKYSVRYTGKNYAFSYNNQKYGAKSMYSLIDRINGWAIVDADGNYINDPELYSKLALIAEVSRSSSNLENTISNLENTINQSKIVFDKAFKVQLAVDASDIAVDNLSGIEGSLVAAWATGGTSLSKAAQYDLIRNSFKDKYEEVYSMYFDKLKEFSNDLLTLENGEPKISEQELKQKIKDLFGNCYKYQLKLASSELGKAKKLMKKQNKTYDDYVAIDTLIDDGISRGFMASKALNMINKTRTLDNTLKLISNKMMEGAGIDYKFLKLSVETTDLENIQKEAEKEYYKFYNQLTKDRRYWDVNDKNSNASKMLPVMNNFQKRKELLDEARRKKNQNNRERTEQAKMERRRIKRENQERNEQVAREREQQVERERIERERREQAARKIERRNNCTFDPSRKDIIFEKTLNSIYENQLYVFSSSEQFPAYERGSLDNYYREHDYSVMEVLRKCDCNVSITLLDREIVMATGSHGRIIYARPWIATLSCNFDDDLGLEKWTINDDKITNQISED